MPTSNQNYLKIFFSIVINNFGDVLFDLFIVWKITRETDSIMSAVYMIGSSILFRAILSIFIGFLVDIYNKKRMIIISNLCSACIILLFAMLYDVIKTTIGLGVFFILLNDINNEIFGRSTMLMSSELFDKGIFIKFQARYSVINRVVVIAGSSIVGFLIALIPDAAIFTVDIVTFLLSAIVIASVDYKVSIMKPTKKSIASELAKVRSDILCVLKEMNTNTYIIKFIIIMFILNLAYGYIPYILPFKIANDNLNPALLGLIKSTIAIGEIIGLTIISFYGERVSMLFKTSMLGNALVLSILCYSSSTLLIIICFLLYGTLDSITQPLFGYTVSIINEKDRGKIMGGIDAIILLSPSIGMYVVTKVMEQSKMFGYFFLSIVFFVAYIIVKFSKELNGIDLKDR